MSERGGKGKEGHIVFRSAAALEEGSLGSKEKWTERGREGSWPTPLEIFAQLKMSNYYFF